MRKEVSLLNPFLDTVSTILTNKQFYFFNGTKRTAYLSIPLIKNEKLFCHLSEIVFFLFKFSPKAGISKILEWESTLKLLWLLKHVLGFLNLQKHLLGFLHILEHGTAFRNCPGAWCWLRATRQRFSSVSSKMSQGNRTCRFIMPGWLWWNGQICSRSNFVQNGHCDSMNSVTFTLWALTTEAKAQKATNLSSILKREAYQSHFKRVVIKVHVRNDSERSELWATSPFFLTVG